MARAKPLPSPSPEDLGPPFRDREFRRHLVVMIRNGAPFDAALKKRLRGLDHESHPAEPHPDALTALDATPLPASLLETVTAWRTLHPRELRPIWRFFDGEDHPFALRDLRDLARLPNLERFEYVDTAWIPMDVGPLLALPKLREVVIATEGYVWAPGHGTQRLRNDDAVAALTAVGFRVTEAADFGPTTLVR